MKYLVQRNPYRVIPNAVQRILGTGLIAIMLGGCTTGALVGGFAATTGLMAAQERSVGNVIDDNGIRLKLNQHIASDYPHLYSDIATEVVEGRVLLAGSVPNEADMIRVLRLTWKIDGVREVLNEMQIAKKTGVIEYAQDTAISTELRAKILADSDISSLNYTIETVGKTVHLIGVARDTEELRRVTDYARRIKGVEKVVSHVLTRDDPKRLLYAGSIQ